MSLEEKFEAFIKSCKSISSLNQELKNKNEYLRRQLGEAMKQKQKALDSPLESGQGDESEAESHNPESTIEGDVLRRQRREGRSTPNSNDFRVDIPEFEGKLDPEEFLDWISTVERVFEYKDVPEDKKVKLVALKLQKYASLWWTNLCAKRVRI